MQQGDEQEARSFEQHANAEIESQTSAASSTPSTRATTVEPAEPNDTAHVSALANMSQDTIDHFRDWLASYDGVGPPHYFSASLRRAIVGLVRLPDCPVELRWYRRPLWTSARAQLEVMVQTGSARPYVLEEWFEADGTPTQVQVPIWRLMLNAMPSYSMTTEEAENFDFFRHAISVIDPLLQAQGYSLETEHEAHRTGTAQSLHDPSCPHSGHGVHEPGCPAASNRASAPL